MVKMKKQRLRKWLCSVLCAGLFISQPGLIYAEEENSQAAAEATAQAAAQQEYVPEYTAPSDQGTTEVAPPQNTGGSCLGGVVIN